MFRFPPWIAIVAVCVLAAPVFDSYAVGVNIAVYTLLH